MVDFCLILHTKHINEKTEMQRKLLPAALAAAAVLAASCLEDNGGSDVVIYDDTAVTSFSLGTVNTVAHVVNSEGKDSSYVSAVDFSNVKFSIDQAARTIYNTDSLPANADLSKALCNITAKNGGTVVRALKSAGGVDSLVYFQNTDTIDFTSPVEIRVYHPQANEYRAYTVRVSKHTEAAEDIKCSEQPGEPSLGGLQGMAVAFLDGGIVAAGVKGGDVEVWRLAAGASSWEKSPATGMAQTAGAAAPTMASDGETAYLCVSGKVYKSADGLSWQPTGNQGIGEILAAMPHAAYGIGSDGSLLKSEDGCATWHKDGSFQGKLPTGGKTSMAARNAGGGAWHIVLAGGTGGNLSIWGKVEETDPLAKESRWTLYSTENGHMPGVFQGVRFGIAWAWGGLLAVATDAQPGSAVVCKSPDRGLTWQAVDNGKLPEGIVSAGGGFALCPDGAGHLWMVDRLAGRVWKTIEAGCAWEHD